MTSCRYRPPPHPPPLPRQLQQSGRTRKSWHKHYLLTHKWDKKSHLNILGDQKSTQSRQHCGLHCCCLTAAIFRINIPECILHFISLCFSFVSIKTHKGLLSQVLICFKCFHSQRSGDECLVILGPINLPFSQFPPFTITAHHLAHVFFLFCSFYRQQ